MRTWIVTVALSASFASAAFAGGLHARIEGPGADGVTYTARTHGDANATLEPWALAEGVVDGKRQSVLIRLQPTGEHGVYRFARTWSADGRWVIRFCLGNPDAQATVATLAENGAVSANRHYRHTDGMRESQKVLRKLAKIEPGDDC